MDEIQTSPGADRHDVQATLAERKTALAKYAISMMGAEMATIHALAHAVLVQVRPADESDPPEHCDLMAWRLAEVLDERLGKTWFQSAMADLFCDLASMDQAAPRRASSRRPDHD